MRENLSPWAEDDIAQLRYQLERARAEKSHRTLVVWFRNRLGDRDACEGCGYQKCSCPPEPVEEAKPAGKWRQRGNFSRYFVAGVVGGVVMARSVAKSGKWYADMADGQASDWFDSEAEAKAWVEERCST